MLFSDVRELVPLIEYLVSTGWCASFRRPFQLRGPCPLAHHEERGKPRSFAVKVPHKWYCHRCKKGGDVIDLHAARTGKTLDQAARDLLCQYRGTEKRNG